MHTGVKPSTCRLFQDIYFEEDSVQYPFVPKNSEERASHAFSVQRKMQKSKITLVIDIKSVGKKMSFTVQN